MKLLLISLAFCFQFAYSQSNDNAPEFAIFIVEGYDTPEQARAIDTEMRQIPLVKISRMDIRTHRYYIVYDSEATFDQQWFIDKFQELGDYTIHCYFQGVHGTDSFQPMTKESCTELNQD